MAMRCPQCGSEFDRGANQFCPNPKCGFPVAFMEGGSDEEPAADETEMARQPARDLGAPAEEEQETEVLHLPKPDSVMAWPPAEVDHPHETGASAGSRRRVSVRAVGLATVTVLLVAGAVAGVTLLTAEEGSDSTSSSLRGAGAGGGSGGVLVVNPTDVPATAAAPSSGTSAGPASQEVRLSPEVDALGFEPSSAGDRVILYFLRGGVLHPVPHSIAHTQTPARRAVELLLRGPDEESRQAGMTTHLPVGINLIGLVIAEQEKLALVDLGGLPTAPEGHLPYSPALAQIVFTLTQFPSVESVQIKVDGVPRVVLRDGREPLVRVARTDFR